MTNITHTQTPGPWIAHKYPTKTGYGFVIQSEKHRGISIASLSPGISTDRIEPIAEANARLIAAAPAMLTALKRIHIMAVEYGNDLNLPENVAAMFYDIAEDARAAIAKAKGQ